tara:strand:- start:1335 stop:1613 length:279 start_codon:yes stop_codon:yes gene_type:complete
MGKITMKEAHDLHEKGLLDDKALKEMQNSGMVGTRTRHSERRVIKTSKGTYVTPQLYFRGLTKGGEYSKKMTEFRTEFDKLVDKYTTTIKNK